LNRPPSPIRHDYKPSASAEATTANALPWFAAGLGLPLVAVALFLTVGDDPVAEVAEQSVAAVEPQIQPETESAADASHDAPVDSSTAIEVDAEDVIELAEVTDAPDPEFHPPLALPPEYPRVELTVRRGDTLDRLFRRNDLDLGDLAAIVRLPEASPHLKKLIPGDQLTIEHDEGRLVSLYREIDLTNALLIEKTDDGFTTNLVEKPLEVRRKASYGRIETSLYESAADAGLPDKTVMNLAGIFAWDVDFVLDIRSGDDYYVLYEQLYQDGEYLGDGEIIAAEFNNNGRTIQAIRYVDKEGRSDYFTPEGKSVRKAFLRAPVDFRVSSSFNPNRLHPVLKTRRPHRGTDYAAPHGTPIKATGDGKVIFRGVKSGYGNVVILQHGGNITTLYAHMSRFASSVRNGTRVRQGQTIGYVGKTGLVTGTHLHYEYRLNGVHRNSRTVKLPQADPINEEYRNEFLASVDPLMGELRDFKRTQVAALADD
jgi:murein DD-endopeptidase MepM/ murein hydrolase activator NlpD